MTSVRDHDQTVVAVAALNNQDAPATILCNTFATPPLPDRCSSAAA
jgi:hypothetical protein